MIHVLFFAHIRERLGVDRLSVPCKPGLTLAQLREQLVADNGGVWREVLCADNVVLAVNQEVTDEQQVLEEGDEVAFYPPVTGG